MAGFSSRYYIVSDIIQLFHAFVGNSAIHRHEVLWTTRSTNARGHQAEGDSASGRPQCRGAVYWTIARKRSGINVLLPNKAN